jgi:hypothetical protein
VTASIFARWTSGSRKTSRATFGGARDAPLESAALGGLRLSARSTIGAGVSGRNRATPTARRDLLRFLAEGTAGTVGEEFFQRLVERVAPALRADVAFVAEIVPEDRQRARFLACWEGGRLAEPVEYCLAGTPCAEVVDAEDVVWYANGVVDRFPDDEMVVDWASTATSLWRSAARMARTSDTSASSPRPRSTPTTRTSPR